jgi:hypothetical protein
VGSQIQAASAGRISQFHRFFYRFAEGAPVYHFIGAGDTNVGNDVFDSYMKHVGNRTGIRYRILREYTHSRCWERNWRLLLREIGFFD